LKNFPLTRPSLQDATRRHEGAAAPCSFPHIRGEMRGIVDNNQDEAHASDAGNPSGSLYYAATIIMAA